MTRKATTLRGLADLRLPMLNVRPPLATRDEFAAEIGRLWDQSLEGFVEVGRRLNEAKAVLAHGEFEAMVDRDLPFSPSVSRRLRQVAVFVDSGAIPRDQLPGSYSSVFVLSSLTAEELAAARERGLVGPNVKRAELERFRAERRGTALVAEEPDALIGLAVADGVGAPVASAPAGVTVSAPEVLPPLPAAPAPAPASAHRERVGAGLEALFAGGRAEPADDRDDRRERILNSIATLERQRDRIDRTIDALRDDLRRLDIHEEGSPS